MWEGKGRVCVLGGGGGKRGGEKDGMERGDFF